MMMIWMSYCKNKKLTVCEHELKWWDFVNVRYDERVGWGARSSEIEWMSWIGWVSWLVDWLVG
jgi:hypothetical protein